MSESSSGSSPADPPPGPTQGFPPPQRSARVPVIVAIALAAVALIGDVGCSRPASEKPATTATTAATPQYSEQEVAQAQKAVCDAYNAGFLAIKTAGSKHSDDPNQQIVIALNIRLAFQVAAFHLIRTLDTNQATPHELAQNARDLSSAYEDAVLAWIAEKPASEVDAMNDAQMAPPERAIRKVCT
jgi:hypothetical protein